MAIAAGLSGQLQYSDPKKRPRYGVWKVVAVERMHGGLSTSSKTPEGRQLMAESNRSKSAKFGEKRGKRQEVTQRGTSR
jgi:hypothetical protein